jgi:hypothetical protein
MCVGNKKATYNCPVVVPRRRGEACVNGFKVLTTTTTVWIIDTLFQAVSSGIKIYFCQVVVGLIVMSLTLRFSNPGGLFKQSAAARVAHLVS